MQARTLHDGVFVCLRQIGDDLGGFRRSPPAISRPLGYLGPGRPEPIGRADGQGNTYQQRRLEDGSRHEVLKNFPAESDLRAALEGLAEDARVETLRYYWILSYTANAAVKSKKKVAKHLNV